MWFKQPRRFDMMDHTEKSCLVYKNEIFNSTNSVRKVQNPKQQKSLMIQYLIIMSYFWIMILKAHFEIAALL